MSSGWSVYFPGPVSSVKMVVSQRFKKMLISHLKLEDSETPENHTRFHHGFDLLCFFPLSYSIASQLSKPRKPVKVP